MSMVEIGNYEVEVKLSVRKTSCTKKELKREVNNQLISMSYQIEDLKINIK